MKRWKQLQQQYHANHPIEDVADGHETVVDISIVDPLQVSYHLISYFLHEQENIIQPYKAMCVAIIYAKLLEKYFGEEFYAALNDPDLLFGNDLHFIPYQQQRVAYNLAIADLNRRGILEELEKTTISQVAKTILHFYYEFSIILPEDVAWA